MQDRAVNDAIQWSMVGGGEGSEIGATHRDAAKRDGLFDLKAGAFDIDPARSVEFGAFLGLERARCYPDYEAMLIAERERPDCIEAVTVATPNSSHYSISRAALEAGIHVICEKPLAIESEDARKLRALAEQRQLVLGVAYGYSGYPMVHQARAMIDDGELGEIRLVHMQFAHGHHAAEVEQRNPEWWRGSPEHVGSSYVLADIGTHVFHMASLMTGLSAESLACCRQSFVRSRAPLEDNAYVWFRYSNGAQGSLWASAVNVGSAHGQSVRVIGSKASIEWHDEFPNQLTYAPIGGPVQILERGMAYLHGAANFGRVGAGHPEGFFDSWANIYGRFAAAIGHAKSGNYRAATKLWYPGAEEGVAGVEFVEACVESANNGSKWVSLR